MALADQFVGEMAAYETGTTRDENFHKICGSPHVSKGVIANLIVTPLLTRRLLHYISDLRGKIIDGLF